MIEGLKVTINGAELVKLCEQRAEHHRQRAATYESQREQFEANQIEGMGYSNGDPRRTMQEKASEHANDAAELEFIAKHLDPAERYLLDRNDLHKIGVCKRGY